MKLMELASRTMDRLDTVQDLKGIVLIAATGVFAAVVLMLIGVLALLFMQYTIEEERNCNSR